MTILAESLEKKKQVLLKIQAYNEQQERAFSTDAVEMDDFDAAVEEKGRLIDELTMLDSGFETLYAKLARQLQDNPQQYAQQISGIQQLISVITELSVGIQAQEKRNKQLIEQYFAKQRAVIGERRKVSRTAYDYYKKVNNASYNPPQFMDSKK